MKNFKRVFITGDKHGSFYDLRLKCQELNMNPKDDLVIILGDAGINYYPPLSKVDAHIKYEAALVPATLLCVRGNHEDRPENRPDCELYVEGNETFYRLKNNLYENILFAIDGGEYHINNKDFLTIGGAYSVDKDYRISFGKKWVENEMLTIEERMEILDNIYRQNYDYILTHTCPFEWMPKELFLSCINQSTVNNEMEHFLSDVKKYCDFENWYFGHYHGNKQWNYEGKNVVLLYEDVMQIM